jgi:hypothetical protein
MDYLLAPITALMNRIYEQKYVPKQWLVAKTIPIYKKGANNDIENYKPIANLSTASKIFEKLIMKRIIEIQDSWEWIYQGLTSTDSKEIKVHPRCQ